MRKPLLRTQPLMQTVSSNLSTLRWLPESHRQNSNKIAGCASETHVWVWLWGDRYVYYPVNTLTPPSSTALLVDSIDCVSSRPADHSHCLMSKGDQHSISSSIILLIDWFSQLISQRFSLLQRQKNSKLPLFLEVFSWPKGETGGK